MLNQDQSNDISVEHLYPLGFVYKSSGEFRVPPTFARIDAPIPIAVHHQCRWTCAGDAARFVILLGTAVDNENPTMDRQHLADTLLVALSNSEDSLCQRLDSICGRYAIFYVGSAEQIMVLNDATGLRTVFYSESGSPRVIASHCQLVEDNHPTSLASRLFAAKWGYPGMATPVEGISLLTPNTRLNLATGTIERFYPRERLPSLELSAAVEFVTQRARAALTSLTEEPVALSLTAGIDSRTTLALTDAVLSDVVCFTAVREGREGHRIDADVAAALTRIVGRDHQRLEVRGEVPEQLWKTIKRNSYYHHGRHQATAYLRTFGEHRPLHLGSNLYEIGRAFYSKWRQVEPPLTPQLATELYRKGARDKPQMVEQIAEIQREFERFYEVTAFAKATEFIDAEDLFYWEHRMAAWHGVIRLETDIAFDTFIPINARNVFSAMLSQPKDARIRGALQREIILKLCPALLGLPVNPRPPRPLQQIYRRVSRIYHRVSGGLDR